MSWQQAVALWHASSQTNTKSCTVKSVLVFCHLSPSVQQCLDMGACLSLILSMAVVLQVTSPESLRHRPNAHRSRAGVPWMMPLVESQAQSMTCVTRYAFKLWNRIRFGVGAAASRSCIKACLRRYSKYQWISIDSLIRTILGPSTRTKATCDIALCCCKRSCLAAGTAAKLTAASPRQADQQCVADAAF